MVVWLMINNLNAVLANPMQDSYNQAEAYRGSIKLGNPDQMGNKVIFDKDANVSNLTNMRDHELTNQGGNILNNSLDGKLLQQMEMKKIDTLQEYDLNNNNPLIVNSNKIASDPLKHTEGSHFNSSEVVTKTKVSKNCTEGVNFEIDIIKQLHLEAELVDKWGELQDRSMVLSENDLQASWCEKKIKEHYYSKGNWWRASYYRVREEDENVRQQLKVMVATKEQILLENIGEVKVGYTDKSYWSLHYITVPNATALNYTYRDKIKEFKEKGEYWQVINEESEKLAEENECYELNRICLESGNKIFFNNYVINRPCWKEQISYQCTSQPQDGCKSLKAQGCQLENSNCLKRHGNICLLWQRNYSCFTEKKSLNSSLNGASMFCLGGDCFAPTIEQNTDISNIGYLAMLGEMKKDIQSEPIEVFKGEGNSCRKNIVNFLNCCSSMKGWGKDLGLGRCKATEKALALKRSKGQCHFVGSYCSERDPIFNKCLTKKFTYCCFNSKLARIFQEQGKQQLGLGFGSAENANCRGFTLTITHKYKIGIKYLKYICMTRGILMANVQLSNTYELGDKWLEREFRHVNLGDKRLIARLIKTTTLLEGKASGSINQSCKSWREAKGAHRLLSNKKFNPEEIYSSHYKETGERIKGNKYVCSVQDTSNLDFDSHIKTKGLGSISKAYTKHKMGLMVHTALMLTMEGLPLGLSSQQCWARVLREETAQEKTRRKYISSIKEKESYKWITALQDTMNIIPVGTQVVTIGDREADIFELLWRCQELSTLFIVRNRQNRKFICPKIGKTNLQTRINQIRGKEEMVLQIPKKQGQKSREAKIEIKYISGLIPISSPSLYGSKDTGHKISDKVAISVVRAKEIDPPEETEAIDWTLLTNIPVVNFKDAIERINCYKLRWKVEEYFRVLKSGCKIENSRLSTKDRLEKLIALKSIIAFKILYLSKAAISHPEELCTKILSLEEWQALYIREHKALIIPKDPPTIKQAIIWLGKLGGFMNRKSDKLPGTMTLWRGYENLKDSMDMLCLFIPQNCG